MHGMSIYIVSFLNSTNLIFEYTTNCSIQKNFYVKPFGHEKKIMEKYKQK